MFVLKDLRRAGTLEISIILNSATFIVTLRDPHYKAVAMLCHDIDILDPTEYSGCPTPLAQGRTRYVIPPTSEGRDANELPLYQYLTSRRSL